MNGESLLPYYTAQSGSGMGMFNTAMGKLQRQLYKGEYDIFKYAPIFESDFIQITKRGEVIDVHNRVRMVTVGIASTSPILPLPDVMLLARPAAGCEEPAGQGQVTKRKSRKAAKALELTRLLPLKFVRISIHDREKQQLRLKFATGRSCYLQLCPALNARENLFAYWEKLIYLLRPPVDSNSSTYATPAEDMLCMPVFEEDDRRSLTAADFQGKGDQDQVSIRSLYVVSEVSGVTSAAFAGGEGTQYDSPNPTAMPDVATKASLAGVSAGASAGGARGSAAGALSLAISRSGASQELSTAIAGAAALSPGGNKTKVAIAGAANVSPKNIKAALAGAADRPSESPSSTSLPPEARTMSATAEAEPTSKAVAEIASDPDVEALISTLPSEGSEGASRRQHGPPSRTEAHKSRRERRERREKDRARRTSRHRRVSENRHRAGGDKAFQKSSGRSSARQRDDKKEKGRGSPGGGRHGVSHRGISHAPITKDSRISHKSGRSSSTTSSSSTAKRLSRISSFLRNVKANLTTKAVASLRGKDVDVLTKTAEGKSTESNTEVAESGQGLEMADSVKSEAREKATFEAH